MWWIFLWVVVWIQFHISWAKYIVEVSEINMTILILLIFYFNAIGILVFWHATFSVYFRNPWNL